MSGPRRTFDEFCNGTRDEHKERADRAEWENSHLHSRVAELEEELAAKRDTIRSLSFNADGLREMAEKTQHFEFILLPASKAAYLALRSYQYGNVAEDLAEETADALAKAIDQF
jgi:hypothetical protein